MSDEILKPEIVSMTPFQPSIYDLPHQPLPSNSHPSATLGEQSETEQLIESLVSLTAPPSQPGKEAKNDSTVLRPNEHVQFFSQSLFRLPAGYVSLDASRPWLIFWTVHSLDLLGVGLDQGTKDR